MYLKSPARLLDLELAGRHVLYCCCWIILELLDVVVRLIRKESFNLLYYEMRVCLFYLCDWCVYYVGSDLKVGVPASNLLCCLG